MGPVQIREIDLVPIFLDPVPDSRRVLIPVKHLDAHLLQCGGIRFLVKEIISQKLHHISLFQEHFQILVRGLGTGIPVKCGHIVIHHQHHRLALAALPGPKGVGIAVVDALLFKLPGPLFLKLPAVFHLIALEPGAVHIRAVGNALKMDHPGKRLVHHPVTGPAHLKCQIRILAVGRRKALVKTADLLPQRHGQQDRRPGNVVHILHIVVFRLFRVVQTPVIPAGTVAPDDSARLLKAAVRVHQLGADHADGRIGFDQVYQGGQPARRHLGVVVQEHDVFSPGRQSRLVAVAQKALVGGIAPDHQPFHELVKLRRGVR